MVWLPAALAPLALAALLWARYREQRLVEAVSKPLCSALFIVAALVQPWPDATYAGWILAGLACSFVGDQLLLGKQRVWLGLGIAAFLLAHVAYLIAAWPLLEHVGWEASAFAAATLGVGALVLRAAWANLDRLLIPALAYVVALSGITTVALCVAIQGGVANVLLGVGMALFYVSDISVARNRLIQEAFVNKLWGLPAYYAAQHLLALSIALR